jgi:ketosteroid isomerase-like protein
MIEKTFASAFVNHWIDSWNEHDLGRILSHYVDDFEMSSPIIVEMAGEPSGTLRGKAAVGAYWAKALTAFPDLHLDHVATLAIRGVTSTGPAALATGTGVTSASALAFGFRSGLGSEVGAACGSALGRSNSQCARSLMRSFTRNHTRA